jgi:hypothetical protein
MHWSHECASKQNSSKEMLIIGLAAITMALACHIPAAVSDILRSWSCTNIILIRNDA